jgi:tripartite-type tricarboxylate transporter receptor subunit TctC
VTSNLISRRDFSTLALGAGASTLLPASALAQAGDYPNKPVQVVIGFPAGSGADILGRYFTRALEEKTRQSFVVVNRAGATSNIAIRSVATAPPDGYTLLFVANSNMAGSRYLFKSLPFDTLKDFVPVASFAQIAFVLVLSPKSKINSVPELVAHLKAKKDNLYGYTNQTAQLSTELFKQMTGIPAKPLPYKTAPDAMKEITDEAIDFMIMDGTFAAGQIAQGALKALAVTTSVRSPSFPDVPTMQEVGLEGFDFAPWWCAYAPAGTPQAIVDKLEGLFMDIAKMPETANFLKSVGAIVNNDPGKKADARLRAEMPRWESLVKAAGIEPQ